MLQIQTEITNFSTGKTVPPQNKSEKTLSFQVAQKYRDKIYHGKRLLRGKGKTVLR